LCFTCCASMCDAFSWSSVVGVLILVVVSSVELELGDSGVFPS
jgi:hypothetical protein